MSLSAASDELKRASGSDDVASSTTTANLMTLEATEDRRILGFYLQTTVDAAEDGFIDVEFSESAERTFDGPDLDETSSPVLGHTYSKGDSTSGWAIEGENYFELPNSVHWGEGEEIHVHANNQTPSGQRVRIIVFYERT